MLKSEFTAVIKETQLLLKNNSGWRGRWVDYAKQISDKKPIIDSVRKSFRERPPLMVYLNITSAKTANKSVNFELRYKGQTVAELTGNIDGRHKLSTEGTKSYKENNKDHFGCDIPLEKAEWDGKDAAKFRSFFKHRRGVRNVDADRSNDEHRLESLLLTEFSIVKNKKTRNIRPVRFGSVRFPMPTPIIASNHKNPQYPQYGKRDKGGGIDILARTGKGGKATHLCIMELKDENTRREPPKDAMKQAVAYTTFIRELLRSDAGEAWWKLFGFGGGGKVPKPLVLYAACVMRSNLNNDYSFRDMELEIEEDTIKLHYLYFTEENDRIKIKPEETTLAVVD
jgi:hypothetical protein